MSRRRGDCTVERHPSARAGLLVIGAFFFGKDFGLFHQANPDTRDFLQGVLLVFIHGINSNATECWEGDLPEEKY